MANNGTGTASAAMLPESGTNKDDSTPLAGGTAPSAYGGTVSDAEAPAQPDAGDSSGEDTQVTSSGHDVDVVAWYDDSSSTLHTVLAWAFLAVLFGLLMFGAITELMGDNETRRRLEDTLPVPVGDLDNGCCSNQFDADALRFEKGWLTAFVVLQSIMLAGATCATCSGIRTAMALASSDVEAELGATISAGDVFRFVGTQSASAGVGGIGKWFIYTSIANKLRYWGMSTLELDNTYNGGYAFGEFGPLPSESGSMAEHLEQQAARIGGNASRTIFLAVLLLASGATLGGISRTAIPVAGVTALFMTLVSSIAVLFNHAQRVEIWTGFPSTVLVPANPAPGLDYGNLTLSGTTNPGLEPGESTNLIIADWIFISQMLMASVVVAGPLLYGLVKGLLTAPCCSTTSRNGFAQAWVIGKGAIGACAIAACCSIIAAPMLAVASNMVGDKWPEGDSYLSFPSSQFDPDASHAAYDGALLALILLMTVLPVGVACLGAVAQLTSNSAAAEHFLSNTFIGRYVQATMEARGPMH